MSDATPDATRRRSSQTTESAREASASRKKKPPNNGATIKTESAIEIECRNMQENTPDTKLRRELLDVLLLRLCAAAFAEFLCDFWVR
jgi:hypothetical protein